MGDRGLMFQNIRLFRSGCMKHSHHLTTASIVLSFWPAWMRKVIDFD